MAHNNYPFCPALDEAKFRRVYRDDITKAEYKELLKAISERFSYVFQKAWEIMERKWDWFDYDNEGGEDHPGVFDPDEYTTAIGITGEYDSYTKYFDGYEHEIPIEWLYTDFEQALKAEYMTAKNKAVEAEKRAAEKARNDKAQRKADDKIRKQKHAEIRAKLSTEDLRFIKFI